MESLINYESDDGESKITKKHRLRESNDKNGISTKSSNQRKPRSRSVSSSSSDSDDDDKRKRLNEKKSTLKSFRDRSDKYHRRSSSRDNDRHHRRSSSREVRKSSSKDSDRYDRKRKYEDRDDKSRNYRKDSKEMYRNSREKERNKHRDSSGERRRDKYDRRESERRSDDRRQRDHESRDNRNSRDKYERNDRYKDDHYRRRNDSPRDGKDSDNNQPSCAPTLSNSINALRKAEALNRTIERRANEKVQQLQKLGIEIPAMMQHHQQQQQQQLLLQQQLQTKIQTAQMRALSMASMLTTIPNTTVSQTPDQHSSNECNSDDNLNLNLTNFTSPILANARYTEQMQKKKLIWGSKKAAATTGDTVTTNNKWEAAKFSQDSDGKVASKFLRLMGMKNVPATVSINSNANDTASGSDTDPSVEKREQMFNKMEQQYEIARQTTHTMRGMGLGFGSQSRPC